jgi:NAD(P)-dependent dehydrogenase (short-subunit alcohol dehydrogenase family)
MCILSGKLPLTVLPPVSGQQALSHGGKVIATARKVDKISQLKNAGAEILQMDVTSAQSELDAKVAKAISIFGRIDVLVSNAAFKKWVSGGYEVRTSCSWAHFAISSSLPAR